MERSLRWIAIYQKFWGYEGDILVLDRALGNLDAAMQPIHV